MFFFLLFQQTPFLFSSDLGGAYYCFDVVVNQISCWVSASLFIDNFEGDSKLDGSTIFLFLGVLLSLWLSSAFLFFYKIKREYWTTFYSLETGGQNARAYFLENDDDGKKSLIFKRSRALWKEIEGEVKAWTLSKWSEWEEKKPEWFTDNFKESVPDEMIPQNELNTLNRNAKGGKRRRSALVSLK